MLVYMVLWGCYSCSNLNVYKLIKSHIIMDEKIKESFQMVKKDFSIINDKIDEIRGDVRKEIDKINDRLDELHKQLHLLLREPTTRKTTRSNLNPTEKKILKEFDKNKLMRAIKGYIDDGYETIHIRDEIINRFGIGTTCFYKYLKSLRVLLRQPTTRSSQKEEI